MPSRPNSDGHFDIIYVVTAIKLSEGGYKLSQEALTCIAMLGWEGLTHNERRDGFEVLMSAHDYVWKDRTKDMVHRLEVCELLFDLAERCATRS